MKTFTVIAHCKHVDTRYNLHHDGEKWVENAPYEETTFQSRKDAEEFAKKESESFDVRHEMEIIEFDDEE